MRFGILGPLEVRAADGRSVRVPELKVRALLAALLVGQGRPASADGLVEDLWGARPPAKPVSALRAKVSQLRRALDNGEQGSRELVVSGTSGYLLRLGPDAVDASRFEALVSRAHSLSDTRARSSVLAEALALWRGPALADFADEAFAQAAITRLEEQRLAALEAQAEARLELGEHHLMVGELNDLVTAHPLRERVRAAQMRSLYRSGQQTAALQSYTELYQRLDEELGLAPGTELAELQQAILQQDPSLDPPSASAATAARPRTNLAPAPTELVGRARETDEVLALLRTERLVTLIGPGGVGKTRLAREAAGSLLHSFPGGAWIVEPSGGQGPLKTGAQPSAADVASEVAEAMELPDPAHAAGGETGVIDRLAAALASGPTLLVLDGCEHVVTGAAKLTAAMLAAAPELRVLATSREPLDTDGEQLYEVPALDVPEAGGDPAREVIGGSGEIGRAHV